MSEFADLRSLIALNQLIEPQGRTHAAMLSLLDKKEAAGEDCPGWVELEDEAEALYAGPKENG